MLLRLLSIVVLFNVVHAVVENPCKDKLSSLYCHDAAASCAVIFQQTGGEPNPNCFDTTNPDHVFADSCRRTCQLCCLEPQYNCDDDPLPNIECLVDEACDGKTPPGLDARGSDVCNNLKNTTGDLCSMSEVSVQCEKTCEVCIPDDCIDSSTRCSLCASNGFCEDPFYTSSDADSKYCKRTCGLC